MQLVTESQAIYLETLPKKGLPLQYLYTVLLALCLVLWSALKLFEYCWPCS